MDLMEFCLPDVGEGLTEADVVTWHVAVGDEVVVDDLLLEIETAKSVVELPSPYAGRVVELAADPGQTVLVGAPLVRLAPVGAELPEPAPEPAPEPDPEPNPELAPERAPVLVGYGVVEAPPRRRHITKPTADRSTPPSGMPPAMISSETRMPIRGVQRAMADAMTRSAFTAPHVTLWLTIDMTASMELVRGLRGRRDWDGVRVTPLTLVARALLLAVGEHPEVNASWDEEAQEIVRWPQVNLGIAAATPRGLVVPNIKGADRMGFRQLAHELTSLIETARAGRTAPAEMAGGTITITNVGSLGVDGGTPILNPGEAAILAFGGVRRQPWVVADRVVVREVAQLALSFDHRFVDGELGSRILTAVGDLLANPQLALARG